MHQGAYVSLIRFTFFMYSVLVTLKSWCLTSGTTLEYTDDLAACCLSKYNLGSTLALKNHCKYIWPCEF